MCHLSMEYLSCYWSDFDQTLKVGSWDHLWQTPAVKMTFVQENLSSWTDSKCHTDICPCNICSCDICTFKEYLSCYWSNFDQTLKVGSWDHLWQTPAVMVTSVQETFVLATFFHIRNMSAVTDPIWPKIWSKILFNPNLFEPKTLLDPKLFWTQIIGNQIFRTIILGKRILCLKKFLDKKLYLDQHFFEPKFFMLRRSYEAYRTGNVWR